MSNLWERFDDIATPDEIEEARVQATPLEAGNYTMILQEIKPDESKEAGLPMLKGVFRLEENNRAVYYNQVLQNLNYPNLTARNIAAAVEFVGGLLGEEITYTGLSALADDVERIEIGTKVIMEVSYAKKDTEKKFPVLKVISLAYDENEEEEYSDAYNEDENNVDGQVEPVDEGDQAF